MARDAYAGVLLPDQLPFNKRATSPNAVPGVFSGRRLEDDVVDIALNILTGGDLLDLFTNHDANGGITGDEHRATKS